MRAPCGVYSKFMNPNSFQPLAVPGTDEIREILVKRIDQQKQAVGIVVGVIEPPGRRVVAYGNLANGDPRPLDGDTIFEIGSISKVFTSLLLADMVNRKEVALDDPAAKYLPEHVKMPERSGKSITPLGGPPGSETSHRGRRKRPLETGPKRKRLKGDKLQFIKLI